MATLDASKPPRPTLADSLERALRSLAAIEGVTTAFLASRDGLLVASGDNPVDGADVKAALVAALFGAVDRAAPSLELGAVRAALVETATSSLQILSLSNLLLVVNASKNANMAHVRLCMAKTAQELASIAA